PFVDTWRGGWISPIGFLLNVLFFVPFGLLGARSTAHSTATDGGRRRLAIVLAGLLLSLGVETLQVFTRDRIPASGDVLANAIGAITGVALAARGSDIS